MIYNGLLWCVDWCAIVYCGELWCTVVYCGLLWFSVVYSGLQGSTVVYSALWVSLAIHPTAPYFNSGYGPLVVPDWSLEYLENILDGQGTTQAYFLFLFISDYRECESRQKEKT